MCFFSAGQILSLPRYAKRAIVLACDLLVVTFALWAAFSLHLGVVFGPSQLSASVFTLFLVAPVIAIPIFVRFGLYRAVMRYVGFKAMWAIMKGATLYALVFGVLVSAIGLHPTPVSVLLINWLMVVLLIGGTRAMGRWWLTADHSRSIHRDAKSNVIIYGAGEAGVQLATALSGGAKYRPVAFIDDDLALHGRAIEGSKVFPFSQLDELIVDLGVSDVLVAMPSASRSERSRVIAKLEPYPVHVKLLPDLNDLASGRFKADDIREVEIEDLLGRNPVEPDFDLLNANVRGKVVLVTGAGGSIGSELCRQIIKIGAKKIILFERSEPDLYAIENEMIELLRDSQREFDQPEEVVVPILASILNQERLETVCKAFGVQTIYHAAAYKQVPMIERNPSEAVHNNVLGTYRAARAAIKSGVETFVLISTDKAVRPSSTMGATKRFAEMILQCLAQQLSTKTRFTMVRFGNVLGSSSSVVPLFREQIQKGGPVTVTDSRIIRYFMTIPEAAQLVIQAGAMGRGGDVFVLDMGEAVRIIDLAKRMIQLSGLDVQDEDNPDGDIEIKIVGLRPGEKLYEELLIGDNVQPTRHPLIRSATEDCLSWAELSDYLRRFEQNTGLQDAEYSRSLLVEAVSGFSPQCELADIVRGQTRFKLPQIEVEEQACYTAA